MKNSKKLTLALFSLVVIFSSCKKDPEPKPIEATGTGKFHKMSSNEAGSDSFFKLFTYDTQGNLIKIDMDGADVEYSYDGNNRKNGYVLNYEDGSPSMNASIYYHSGSQEIDYILSEFPIVSGIPKDSAVFEYQNDHISKIKHYIFLDMGAWKGYVETDSTEYLYDVNGNLAKESRHTNGGTEVLEYTYDDKNSPWNIVIKEGYDPLLGAISKNNVLSFTYSGTNGMVDQDESYTAVYTYNKDSYPVTAEFTFNNGATENYTLEYN